MSKILSEFYRPRSVHRPKNPAGESTMEVLYMLKMLIAELRTAKLRKLRRNGSG